MKRHAIIVMVACSFALTGTGFGAAATGKLTSEALETRIREHRMGDLIVRAKPAADVHIEQLRHEFWFGAALSSGAFSGRLSAQDQRRYEETFLANFNAAVTENAVKWASMERRKGQVDYRVVDTMLAWTEKHDIPLRGHCVFWGIPNRVQDWLKQTDDDELLRTLENRARDVAGRYRGRFAEFDSDPDARLFLNDYDILTGKRLDDYMEHIREFLDQGVPFAGIGVQGHLHGESFEPEALQHALDELSKIGLPIRVTDFNMPGQRSRFMRRRDLKLTDEQEQ
ncbi:MAG: endo-1,4-beta-xylanase, partial [Planctomycetota bacterium]